ncbi:MAG: hypothetical protein WC011_00485 [Candidatus Paceibacterota bacterium]
MVNSIYEWIEALLGPFHLAFFLVLFILSLWIISGIPYLFSLRIVPKGKFVEIHDYGVPVGHVVILKKEGQVYSTDRTFYIHPKILTFSREITLETNWVEKNETCYSFCGTLVFDFSINETESFFKCDIKEFLNHIEYEIEKFYKNYDFGRTVMKNSSSEDQTEFILDDNFVGIIIKQFLRDSNCLLMSKIRINNIRYIEYKHYDDCCIF